MAVSRTVVLGSNGFIARGLIQLLEAQSHPCRPVGSAEVDLSDPTAVLKLRAILQPGDAVVVCSALTPEHGRDRAAFQKNVRMADHVAGALEGSPAAHVVYLSSDSVTNPSGDFYALAHLVREQILQAACANRIPLTILRPGAVFGPGDTHNAYGPNRFIRTARAERKISLFGEGEEQRDHIYIRDLSRIIQLCIQNGVVGSFDGVAGDAVTFRDLALAIDRAMGGGITIESAPRRVAIAHRHADPSPLLAALSGFRPTPLDQALAETLASPVEPPKPPATAAIPASKPRPTAPVQNPIDVTLMVPCLNEEKHIWPTLDQIFAAMRDLPYTYEVLVIDDGSADGTSAVVEEYMEKHPDLPLRLHRQPSNRGLTRTYVDGAFLARGKYYRQVCGDNVEDKSVLLASLAPLGKADMIIPYREKTPGKSAFREWLSHFYTFLMNTLSGHHIRYYNGQATHIRYNVMRWGPYSFGFGFQAELITRLLDEGATYIEVSVGGSHTNKEGKNSALNLKNFLSVSHTLLETLIRRIRKSTFKK
jgi:nucleoside-diphosphate-sugar epimerase